MPGLLNRPFCREMALWLCISHGPRARMISLYVRKEQDHLIPSGEHAVHADGVQSPIPLSAAEEERKKEEVQKETLF